MTIYPIKWTNDPPRTDLDNFVQYWIGQEDFNSPKGLNYHHIPIIEGDYDGPAVIVSSTEAGDVWVCEHVMPTEGGGDVGINIPVSELRDSEGNLPGWLQQIINDSES